MNKNNFLIFNEILYELYQCATADEIRSRFFPRLKMLIPFSYISLLLAAPKSEPDAVFDAVPYCYPESFQRAELWYIRHCQEDPLLWLIHGSEPTLVRESDLLPEESRLNSPLYLQCYQKYNIYDSLQYSSIHDRRFLGVLTLFRTRIDGLFSDEDTFYLRSVGQHLNAVLLRIADRADRQTADAPDFSEWIAAYHLTGREAQLLPLLFSFLSNEEIAAQLAISENTVQKHLQNLFRKLNVTSKWELFRLWKNG